MEADTTIKILFGVFGFIWGAALPLAVIYSVWFIKKHGSSARQILRLGARLLFLAVGFLIASALWSGLLARLAGVPSTSDVEIIAEFLSESGLGPPGAVGTALGSWGGLLALLVGLWRGLKRRRHRAAEPNS